LEKTEKRRKDTEKAYQAERQERLRLEKELAKKDESSQKPPEDKNDEDDENLLFDVDDPDDDGKDPEKETKPTDDSVKAKLEEVEQKTEELEKKQALEAWERASDKVREDHKDFDEVVYQNFYKAFETSPKVQEKFREKGSTPEAAYELGLEIKKYNDAISGDTKSNEKTDDTGSQQTGENAETQKPPEQKADLDPSDALGGNSSGSAPSTSPDAGDAVEQALAGIV